MSLVHQSDRPRRPRVPADELTRRSGDDPDEAPEDARDDERGVRLVLDTVDDPVVHLLRGDIEVEGRMPNSSNATFLVHVDHDGARHPAIYKPMRGERPLWDFEPGLHRREVATYLMSEALGYRVVPPTVLRDGPLGEGSLQWWVTADHREHYFTIYETRPELHDDLRKLALLDIVVNNTDRKSGHCLLVPGSDDRPGSVQGIDHGLCFAAQFKLRTVIWEFADEPIDDALLDPIAPLCGRVPLDIAALLDDDGVEAIRGRAAGLVKERRFPVDDTGRRYPWPLV